MFRINPFEVTITKYGEFWKVYKPNSTFEDTPEKVIMLVGGTGTGKSTLINRMANYLLGIKYDDLYRFEVVPSARVEEQTNEQTSEVTVYQFCKSPLLTFNLSIIDTPGFGGNNDSETRKKIKSFYDASVFPRIDAIGLVVKYNQVRLSKAEKCIIESVTRIFTKEVERIFYIMATFCDDPDSAIPVLELLKKEKIPCSKVHIFNNGPYIKSAFQKLHWENNERSFESFIQELDSTIQSVSLEKSRELLQNQDNEKAKLQYLSIELTKNIHQMDKLAIEKAVIDSNKFKIENNKSFSYAAKNIGEKAVKITDSRYHATRCKNCETVCHFPCSKVLSIRWCSAMTLFDKKMA